MKNWLLIVLLVMVCGCEAKDFVRYFIETESMKRPIKIARWNKDGTLNKVVEGRITTINVGARAKRNHCYAITMPEIKDQYIVVPKDPDWWSNGEWGCWFHKDQFRKDLKFDSTNGLGKISAGNMVSPGLSMNFFEGYFSLWEDGDRVKEGKLVNQ